MTARKIGRRIKAILPWAAAGTVALLWIASRLRPDFSFGERVGRSSLGFLAEIAGILPAMFILVGLFEVWVPRASIERFLGREAGWKAVPWLVVLAALQAGPLYGAFPVAVGLARKGCSTRNVFIYLGAFSTLKIPLLTFEVGFLGWPFSLARVLISLPAFILVGILMDRLVPGWAPPDLQAGSAPRGLEKARLINQTREREEKQ
ncbi:MAG: permease [Candidatus Aminicenantes bacterium]|nr:permease [Candidatus Aminicenantes bacterium]